LYQSFLAPTTVPRSETGARARVSYALSGYEQDQDLAGNHRNIFRFLPRFLRW
jgi:hypothetical protein